MRRRVTASDVIMRIIQWIQYSLSSLSANLPVCHQIPYIAGIRMVYSYIIPEFHMYYKNIIYGMSTQIGGLGRSLLGAFIRMLGRFRSQRGQLLDSFEFKNRSTRTFRFYNPWNDILVAWRSSCRVRRVWCIGLET